MAAFLSGFSVTAGSGEKKELPLSYKIESNNGERLSYFDMMIADAVYTLEVSGAPVLYPKNIYGNAVANRYKGGSSS